MFLTSYIDVTSGERIRSPKLIARNYLIGGFLTDFISTIPLVLK